MNQNLPFAAMLVPIIVLGIEFLASGQAWIDHDDPTR